MVGLNRQQVKHGRVSVNLLLFDEPLVEVHVQQLVRAEEDSIWAGGELDTWSLLAVVSALQLNFQPKICNKAGCPEKNAPVAC